MQDQYVGDIGDFGKYGLLRAFSGDPLRLGVVWYLFPDETDKDDGKFIGYLKNPTARDKNLSECDAELYNELHKIVVDGKDRKIVRIQESAILPDNTLYHDQSLSYLARESQRSRKRRRQSWLRGALAATAKADIVFVDPDNGVTEKPIQHRKNGPKYVFMDDLRLFYDRGQSVIIYHHLARWDKADDQIRYFAKRLKERLSLPRSPWALRYRRGTTRVYFIVAQERHRDSIELRMKSFLDSQWRKQGHFEFVT